MRRRLLLSVVLLSAVAVWVGVLRSAPSVRSVRPCVEVPAGPARAGCIEEVLLTADRSGSLLESHDELLGFVAADPTLHDDCHLALHRVGLAVVDDADEVPGLLARLRSPLCSWGLGHGLFEGFGALETSPTQWQALAAACTEMARTADTGALCGDGFGHALWDVLTDQRTAMLGCETLEGDQLQIACAGGVMMQQLRPADGSRAVRRDLPPDEVLARCVDQELLTYSWFVPGCLSGAGYVLVQNLVEDRFAAGSLTDAAEGLRLADAACRRLVLPDWSAGETHTLCLGSLIGNLSARLRSADGSFAGICARLPDPTPCRRG